MFTFRKIRGTNADLMQVQDNVANVFSSLSLLQILDGVLLTDQVLGISTDVFPKTVTIPHTLGRQPLGWIPVDRNSNATIYRTAWDARTITFTISGALTIAAWVF